MWHNNCIFVGTMRKIILMMSLFLGMALFTQAQTETKADDNSGAPAVTNTTGDNADATGDETKEAAKTTEKN